MTLYEYVREVYPIQDKIARILKDPRQVILERDDLPCDDVKMVDGVYQKVVYISDDEFVPVVDLLDYREDDMAEASPELRKVWENYINSVSIEICDFESLASEARAYLDSLKQRGEYQKRVYSTAKE